jgi:hypothetical protein
MVSMKLCFKCMDTTNSTCTCWWGWIGVYICSTTKVEGKLDHMCISILLPLPQKGLAPNGEVEASVDLVAHERPGHYG